jgi:hypothetical protein
MGLRVPGLQRTLAGAPPGLAKSRSNRSSTLEPQHRHSGLLVQVCLRLIRVWPISEAACRAAAPADRRIAGWTGFVSVALLGTERATRQSRLRRQWMRRPRRVQRSAVRRTPVPRARPPQTPRPQAPSPPLRTRCPAPAGKHLPRKAPLARWPALPGRQQARPRYPLGDPGPGPELCPPGSMWAICAERCGRRWPASPAWSGCR